MDTHKKNFLTPEEKKKKDEDTFNFFHFIV